MEESPKYLASPRTPQKVQELVDSALQALESSAETRELRERVSAIREGRLRIESILDVPEFEERLGVGLTKLKDEREAMDSDARENAQTADRQAAVELGLLTENDRPDPVF